MTLQFQAPPDWLVKEYMDRKQPGEVINEGAQKALQIYLANKQEEEAKQSGALKSYIDAMNAGGPKFAASVATLTGLKNAPALPGVTAKMAGPGGTAGLMSDQQSSPQANQQPVTPYPQEGPQLPGVGMAAASQTPASGRGAMGQPLQQGPQLPGVGMAAASQPPASGMGAISPLIHASIAAGHGNPLGIQVPAAQPSAQPSADKGPNILGGFNPEDYVGQGKWLGEELKQRESAQNIEDKQRAAKDKAEENGPKSFDYGRAFAKNAGAPDAADSFIELATKEGRNNLTKREMDDLKNSINVSAQKSRSDYFEGSLGIKNAQLRDALIKEARTSMDPYFSSGEGKAQMGRLNSIGRAEPLVNQMLGQKGGGDPHQMAELATAFDRVVKGGGALAQANIEHFLPKTAGVTLANWKEWWTNNPQGTDQQAFIKRTADSLVREKTAIQGQVRQTAERAAPTLRVLKSHYPEDYKAVTGKYLNNSPEIMGPTPGQEGPHGATVTQNGHTYTWNGTAYE